LLKKEEDDGGEEDDEEEDYNDDNANAPVSMWVRGVFEYYEGDYVHVGELFSDSNLSMEQAPLGSNDEAAECHQMAAEFHLLS
jgi:hypothetical protein